MKVSFTRLGRDRELMHVTLDDPPSGQAATEQSLEWHPGANGVPHDLVHLICESELGLPRGFWGLVAAGADFRRKDGAIADLDRGSLLQAEVLTNAVDQAAAWGKGADECVADIERGLAEASLEPLAGLDAAAAGRMIAAVERERALWRRPGRLVADREFVVAG